MVGGGRFVLQAPVQCGELKGIVPSASKFEDVLVRSVAFLSSATWLCLRHGEDFRTCFQEGLLEGLVKRSCPLVPPVWLSSVDAGTAPSLPAWNGQGEDCKRSGGELRNQRDTMG